MRNLACALCIIPLTFALSACNKEKTNEPKPLETVTQKASYSIGVDLAQRFKQQGIEVDIAAMNRGLDDAYNDKTLALDEKARQQSKIDFQNTLREALLKKQNDAAQKNLEAGKAFLAANAKKEGVVTTDSGLQYKVLKSGDGPQPTADDTVTTNYRGTLIDGTEFDSSYKRNKPASFPVKGVIKGWTEALQMMHVGDKWQLFVPSDLAYGATKRSELIQPNSTLIFEIELLGINGSEKAAPKETDSKS